MPFTLPRLNKCCFCLTLRTGSLIIGYVSIIASLLFLSLISYVLYSVVNFVRANKNQINPEHSPEELAKAALGLYITQAYYFLVFTYLLVISVILVIGVHTSRPKLLRVYVFGGFFLLGLALALVLVSMVFVGFWATLPLLKWCFTHFICLLIVRSTYMDMEEESKPPVYEMQTLYKPPPVPSMA